MIRTHCEMIAIVKLVHIAITSHSYVYAFCMDPFTNLLVILAVGPY